MCDISLQRHCLIINLFRSLDFVLNPLSDHTLEDRFENNYLFLFYFCFERAPCLFESIACPKCAFCPEHPDFDALLEEHIANQASLQLVHKVESASIA